MTPTSSAEALKPMPAARESTNVHAAPTPPLRFPAAEWQTFQNEDRHAAKVIICLLLSIFTIALLGYTYIAIWSSQGW